MRDKLYSLLFYNVYAKKLAVYLLNAGWFVNNPLYRQLHNRYVAAVINRYREVPNVVVIENTNVCNSHCFMCPHDELHRPLGVMSLDLFKKVVDQCALLGVSKISLHGFGEPLTDRIFPERVKYAKEKGIPHVGTTSNGALMTKDLAEAVILAGLDQINFSLDAVSPEAYGKIRVGLPFKTVMENVREFIGLRNRLGRTKPLVTVDLIENQHNQGETKAFINRWQGIADLVNITTLHTWAGSYKEKVGSGQLHHQNRFIKREPCRFLWTDLVVNWDGRVSACCQDYEATMVVGDLQTTPLKEVWQGDVLNHLRGIHLKGRMEEIPLCQICDYRSVWWLFR